MFIFLTTLYKLSTLTKKIQINFITKVLDKNVSYTKRDQKVIWSLFDVSQLFTILGDPGADSRGGRKIKHDKTGDIGASEVHKTSENLRSHQPPTQTFRGGAGDEHKERLRVGGYVRTDFAGFCLPPTSTVCPRVCEDDCLPEKTSSSA